ncbi:DUF1749-like protein [Alternaria alternata]|nr:DUF1749-like protein [Alternaria alternata]
MFAKTGLLLLTAAAGVVGDFMVYTEPPIPTSAIPTFANPSDASSWTTSVFLNAQIAYGRLTGSLGEPYQSSLTSARSEIDAFVRTATNYSIPAEVTMADETPTYFSRPDWYTALPSAARSFKEQQVSDQFSIVRSVIAARAPTSTIGSEGAAMPTALAGQWLPAEFGVMAAAAAAAFFHHRHCYKKPYYKNRNWVTHEPTDISSSTKMSNYDQAHSFPVYVHPIPPNHPTICAYERRHSNSSDCKHAVVFIGGLGSGPHTTHYLGALNAMLECASQSSTNNVKYNLWELRMRSSYTAFGYGSLKEDGEDVASLVGHLKGIGVEKIVLVGSSSGCQAIMTYVSTEPAPPPVDGYIMQAPTSDRETAGLLMPQDLLSANLEYAEDLIAKGKEKTIMPASFIPSIITSPVTAYRWYSLASVGGDDDFFSSDLPTSALQFTFGRLDKPMLILTSEKDEMVPLTVDKELLLGRWVKAIPEGLASEQSQIITTADHELSEERVARYFVGLVVEFLKELNKEPAGAPLKVC